MAARGAVFCARTLFVGLVLLAVWAFESRAADRPNRASSSDMAAGRMVDSLFDFEMPASRQPAESRRINPRRFASGLQGKLVRNSDRGNGTPSFALIDRYGGVLRYVEPVERIDLGKYVGQTVGVRRDTGDTLLASQLAFPEPVGTEQDFSGVQLAGYQETIAPGEVVKERVFMPHGQEPIYLDEGLNFGGCQECGSRVGCGRACRAARRRRLGFYFGYELTALRPVITEIETGPLEDDFGFGHRFVGGYEGGSGLGARARYWFYNHGHDYTDPADGSIGIDMDVLDLELTLDEQFRRWGLMVSGGLRYGRAGLTDSEPETFSGTAEYTFEGVGPSVSFEAVRGFGDRGLYFIGNVRGSLLFGDFENQDGVAGRTIEDETMTILENQLGIGCNRNLGRVKLSFRTVWETQFWLNDSWGDDVNGFGGSLGFSGPTTSAEVRF